MELFSRFKLDVRRTSFKPAPFSDTSLITSSHILYSMSTGFSDGKERVKKIIFWSSGNNHYTCSFSRSSCGQKCLKPRGAIITPFTIISVAEYFASCSIDRAYINWHIFNEFYLPQSDRVPPKLNSEPIAALQSTKSQRNPHLPNVWLELSAYKRSK